MYSPIRVIRHIQNGKIVGIVIKYNPPCPPIQVYQVDKDGLERILPNGDRVPPADKDLVSSLATHTQNELRIQKPFIDVLDLNIKFNPLDYLTNPSGDYDFF